MIKTLKKSKLRDTILTSEWIYIYAKTLETFPRRLRNRQKCSLYLLLSTIVLSLLPKAPRQEKVISGIGMDKEDLILSLFTDYMTVYVDNPKE